MPILLSVSCLALVERISTFAEQFSIPKDTADAADNVPAATAIAAGILQGHSPQRPAYWIHTSGAGIFSYLDTDAQTYGTVRDDIFDDWTGIQRILNIPDHAFHRDVDKIVLDAAGAHPDVIRAAIISPTTVYGT